MEKFDIRHTKTPKYQKITTLHGTNTQAIYNTQLILIKIRQRNLPQPFQIYVANQNHGTWSVLCRQQIPKWLPLRMTGIPEKEIKYHPHQHIRSLLRNSTNSKNHSTQEEGAMRGEEPGKEGGVRGETNQLSNQDTTTVKSTEYPKNQNQKWRKTSITS